MRAHTSSAHVTKTTPSPVHHHMHPIGRTDRCALTVNPYRSRRIAQPWLMIMTVVSPLDQEATMSCSPEPYKRSIGAWFPSQSIRTSRLQGCCLLLCISFLRIENCASFVTTGNLPYSGRAAQSTLGRARRSRTTSPAFMFRDATPFLQDTTSEEKEVDAVVDANGNEFVVGCVIRIAADNLKAYQVPPKGRGRYEGGKFVGHDEPYMSLPAGLRGVVTKVYDVEEVSANFPIQVKFVPGEHVDKADTPIQFSMHFLPNEIEVL